MDILRLAGRHLEVVQELLRDDTAVQAAMLQHVITLMREDEGLFSSQIRVQLRPFNWPGPVCTSVTAIHRAVRAAPAHGCVLTMQGQVVSLTSPMSRAYSRRLKCGRCRHAHPPSCACCLPSLLKDSHVMLQC